MHLRFQKYPDVRIKIWKLQRQSLNPSGGKCLTTLALHDQNNKYISGRENYSKRGGNLIYNNCLYVALIICRGRKTGPINKSPISESAKRTSSVKSTVELKSGFATIFLRIQV